MRRLLEAGASPDIPDRKGRTPLHLACEQGDFDCVKEIVRPLLESRWSEETKDRVYNMLHERDYEGGLKYADFVISCSGEKNMTNFVNLKIHILFIKYVHFG